MPNGSDTRVATVAMRSDSNTAVQSWGERLNITARVPGAAQHEVVGRRPGTPIALPLETSGVPDQRCTAALRFALHRIRDTNFFPWRRSRRRLGEEAESVT